MDQIETVLILFFFAGVLSYLAKYLRIAHEILLVIAGLFIGFIPGLTRVSIDPNIVFIVFLPPLLSYAAYYFSWREFKAFIRPIILLAIGAVLFTMVIIAITFKYIFPEIPWSIAFLLGAILSPPDASAVTAIVKNLKVSERLVTILEGESLINDATALVAFKFALSSVLFGTFSFIEAGNKFIIVSLGGIITGVIIGWLSGLIRKNIKDSSLDMVITLFSPFFSYVAAEKFHFSGVIATVVYTLIIARWNPKISTPMSRRKAAAIWELLIFFINSLAFILIGLQLPSVIDTVWQYSEALLLKLSLYLCIVIVLARFVWVFAGAYIPRLIPYIRKKEQSPSKREVLISAWAGMRGIVSLAAAMAIPIYKDGLTREFFPYRDLIIFITYIIVLFTLVVPGLSLPWIIKKLNVSSQGSHKQEELDARIACAEAAMIKLQKISNTTNISIEYIDVIRQEYINRIHKISSRWISPEAESHLKMEKSVQRLRLDLINEERNILISLRNRELIHDSVMLSVQAELDLREIGLNTDFTYD